MEENKDLNSLIVVEQLPIIKEQLQIISDDVDKEIAHALSLECNEENKTEVKKARARLNSINQTLEEKRKAVKKAIEEPYKAFEEVYDELIKNKLKLADGQLKAKIDDIENRQREEKEQELKEFFINNCKDRHLEDWFSFEAFNYPITLSASMKSLKEKVLADLDNVEQGLKLIEMEDNFKDEILLEFKNNLDFGYSKFKVIERHKALDKLKNEQENRQENIEEEKVNEEKIEEIITPKEVIEDDEVIMVQFNIRGKKSKIKELKDKIIELELEWY